MISKFSKYQIALFNTLDTSLRQRRQRLPFRHVVVQAAAGSGKTSTLVEFFKLYSQHRGVVVAFGTKNAAELRQRLPSNAEASTLHSFGNRAWTELCGGWRDKPELATYDAPGGAKLDRIIRVEVDAGRVPKYWRHKVAKLVDLARMHGIVPGSRWEACIVGNEGASSHTATTPSTTQPGRFSVGDVAVNDVLSLRGLVDDTDAEWERLMHHFDVSVGAGAAPGPIIRMARGVLRKSIRYGHRVIDFVDQLYLPTLAETSSWQVDADVVAVDELQDLDGLQRQMVLGLVRSGCVFVGVGDCRQAIFSWRGADADSMDKVVAATNALVLPLPICYRCPTSHLDMARQYSPEIEAAEGAEEGVLERYDDEGDLCCTTPHRHGLECTCVRTDVNPATWHEVTPVRFAASNLQPGDVVLCRSKAPLVKTAYWLLRNRVPARILGRDLARGLVAFVDGMRAPDVVTLLKSVQRMTDKLVSRASELDDEVAVEEALDRIGVLRAVAEDYDGDDVEGFKTRLSSLFGDGEDRDSVVTLATAHKFKGSEALRVWWLDYRRPDVTAGKHEWQRREAVCIRNVLCTRSRRELRLIESASLK